MLCAGLPGRAGRGLLVGEGWSRMELRGPYLHSGTLMEAWASLAVRPQDGDLAGGRTATGARRKPAGPCSEMRWESLPQPARAGARGSVLGGGSSSSGAHFLGLRRRCKRPHSEWVCVPLVARA